ncbi:hypothetical protein EGM70_05720 [Enterobacteriaceae bacterium 89]|nr:hypothetical protein [Enterobacteriaceae bacterium 89]
MKKTAIALSLLFITTGAMAQGEIQHATDDTVAAAHAGADTAKEKLHQTEHRTQEQIHKAHSDGSTTDKMKQDGEKAWNHTKEGSEKAWDKTKQGSEKAWNGTKEGSKKAWDATKDGSQKAWDKTKAGAEDLKKSVSE